MDNGQATKRKRATATEIKKLQKTKVPGNNVEIPVTLPSQQETVGNSNPPILSSLPNTPSSCSNLPFYQVESKIQPITPQTISFYRTVMERSKTLDLPLTPKVKSSTSIPISPPPSHNRNNYYIDQSPSSVSTPIREDIRSNEPIHFDNLIPEYRQFLAPIFYCNFDVSRYKSKYYQFIYPPEQFNNTDYIAFKTHFNSSNPIFVERIFKWKQSIMSIFNIFKRSENTIYIYTTFSTLLFTYINHKPIVVINKSDPKLRIEFQKRKIKYKTPFLSDTDLNEDESWKDFEEILKSNSSTISLSSSTRKNLNSLLIIEGIHSIHGLIHYILGEQFYHPDLSDLPIIRTTFLFPNALATSIDISPIMPFKTQEGGDIFCFDIKDSIYFSQLSLILNDLNDLALQNKSQISGDNFLYHIKFRLNATETSITNFLYKDSFYYTQITATYRNGQILYKYS